MAWVNSALQNLFHFLFWPFRGLSSWVAMILISILTGLFLLAIYRLVSDQKGIKKTKDQIKAHLLEWRLFSDDLVTSFRTQANLLYWNLKYFLHALRPLAVMIIPLVFILSHLNLWFAYKPLSPGETTILKVKLKESYNPLELSIALNQAEGYQIETPPLRIEAAREINWRLRALKPGRFYIVVKVDGQEITKEMVVGPTSLVRLSPVRPSSGLLAQLLSPGEAPLAASPLREISLVYPSRRMNFLGWKIHWLIVYFVLSVIAGFALKKPLKVEI